MSAGRLPVLLLILLALTGCTGMQSAMNPAGLEAEQVSWLLWGMTSFLGLVFVFVMVATGAALLGSERLRLRMARDGFILGLGLVFPAVALTVIFFFGLSVQAERAWPDGKVPALTATITGEQWWWRVVYEGPDGASIASANELRIPVGDSVRLNLETADVIHSFWVPNLAGKLDMIPGRTNVMTLTGTKPGTYRGQCAEYCGGAHALMSFHVVALPPDEFEAWLTAEAKPATAPASPELERGARVFAEIGCGACHTVRGTDADGTIGPDLTHVGGRLSLAAATLPNDAEAFARWIRDNQHIKPENKMPAYDILSENELTLLARYLESLE